MKRIVYVMTSCKPLGPVRQTMNIARYLDRDVFEPYLVTIYPEDEGSIIGEFEEQACHYFAATSQKSVLLGETGNLKKILDAICPDVVHSVGVFPDYAVSRMSSYTQVSTLRNCGWADYSAQYGPLKGAFLVGMQYVAMKRIDSLVACSQSVSNHFRSRGFKSEIIRNGVDAERFRPVDSAESRRIRLEVNLPVDSFLYVYSAPLIKRKNHRFLLEAFCAQFGNNNEIGLVLLGDGPEREHLEQLTQGSSNIFFMGNVDNVEEYLNACNCYVSSSLSEGMPNGVLEAMACGLPYLLSDIEQHKEIAVEGADAGLLYESANAADLKEKLMLAYRLDDVDRHIRSRRIATNLFSAQAMSKKYQQLYMKLATK